jgi:hypothetical protein
MTEDPAREDSMVIERSFEAPVELVWQVRVELEDLGGRTRMVLTHVGIPSDSPGATGWTMALDKLAARIAARTEA